MKNIAYILILLVFFSCKEVKKENSLIKKDSIETEIENSRVEDENIDELKSQKNIKEKFYDVNILDSNSKRKDTLVDFEYLEFAIDYEFNYPKFDRLIDEDTAFFNNEKDSIIIVKNNFNKSNYEIDYDENGYALKINDKPPNGINYYLPLEIIESIKLSANKFIDRQHIEDLFEPNFNLTSVYKSDDEIIIQMGNSDGAGGYWVTLFVDKNYNVKRTIAVP